MRRSPWKLALDAARRGDAEALRNLLDLPEMRAEAGRIARRETPLMVAARRGYAECVKALLEAGAWIGAEDQQGFSALRHAAEGGSAECAALLMEAGADPREAEYLRSPAWLIAAREGSLDVLKEMARFGWDPKRSAHAGSSALHAAAGGEGGAELIGWLVGMGASLGDRDRDEWTAGMIAASRGNKDALAELILRGESPEWEDNRARGALHWACESGESGCAELLVEAGWDLWKEDDEGIDPWTLASEEMRARMEAIRERRELSAGVREEGRSGRARGL